MIVTLLRKPLNGGGGILNALPCASLNIEASRFGDYYLPARVRSGKGGHTEQQVYGVYRGGSSPAFYGRYPTNLLDGVGMPYHFAQICL